MTGAFRDLYHLFPIICVLAGASILILLLWEVIRVDPDCAETQPGTGGVYTTDPMQSGSLEVTQANPKWHFSTNNISPIHFEPPISSFAVV